MHARRPSKNKRLELTGAMGRPADPSAHVRLEDVHIDLELGIGRGDTTYDGVFYVAVFTPESLRAKSAGDRFVLSDRATMIVSNFDWDATRDHIVDILERCEASTLEQSVPLLQRYFKDEYEDYGPNY